MLPCNFTLIDVHASFTEETSSSLRLFAAVQTEEVDVWGLVRHLKIPDGAVSLSEKDHQYQQSRGGTEVHIFLGNTCDVTPFHTGKPCSCQGHKTVRERRYCCPSPPLSSAQRDPSVNRTTVISQCLTREPN